MTKAMLFMWEMLILNHQHLIYGYLTDFIGKFIIFFLFETVHMF